MNDISLVFIINNQKYIKDGHFGCQLKSIENLKVLKNESNSSRRTFFLFI
jgi:hypothetical protein